MKQITDLRESYGRIPHSLIRDYGAELGPYGIAVYAALASYADVDGESFPSYQSIADMVGCSRRKVIRVIQHLSDLKWIAVEHRYREDGSSTSNLYYLLPAPRVVNGVHQGSEPDSPGVVNGVHSFNKNHLEEEPLKKKDFVENDEDRPSKKDWSEEYEAVQESWNSFASKAGLSQIRGVSDKRKKFIRSRYQDIFPRLEEIYAAILQSSFLLGTQKNSRWQCDFDFLWGRRDAWLKIIEGSYADVKKTSPTERKMVWSEERGDIVYEDELA